MTKYKIDLSKTFAENIKLKQKISSNNKNPSLSWLFDAELSELTINILIFIKKIIDKKKITLEQGEKMVCLLLKRDDLYVD